MSIARKDVRAKLDADMHAAMKAIAEADGLDVGEWIESILVPEIKRRIHAARLIAERVARMGKNGTNRE